MKVYTCESLDSINVKQWHLGIMLMSDR